jgi:peroxiredoxin
VGDPLPRRPAPPWTAHDRTLVLALKNGCRFCEESIPFYRKLAELEESNQINAHLIAVFPDDPAAVRQLIETQRLAVEAFPGIELSQVKVDGTPTLILVDRQGRVSKVWIGELEAAGQAEVVTAISKAGAKRPSSVAAKLPPS